MSLTRLNVGCGLNPAAGWLNLDWRAQEGVDLCCDLRGPVPLADRCIDYAVAIHVLQDLAWADIPLALAELRRVLRPGGVLRLGLPDLDRAIEAYRRGDAAYFYVPDADARSLGAKLVTQIVWYGSVRTPFTFDFAHELLTNAGFSRIARSAFRRTDSEHAQIVELDNRERETLFVEAVK
jgi:SAM-dependent methyltransferase